MTDWDDDILGMDKTDEDIIELTDIVEEGLDPATQEDLIELTDIVEEGTIDLDLGIVEETPVKDEENFEIEDEIDFNEGFEIEIDSPADEVPMAPIETIEPAWESSVTQEQIAAALERVIEKKFAEKIDTLLFEVMERVVEQEIARIKKRLLKDLDQM
ncbi:hypothetical protein [Desulfobacula sp.]|uniref:hypothetical protein n=1 Tax=Desulfobacula sp. TaxID=2593537 RepID=UPI0026158ECF|nr:hypothetical protein [Desulfobacula sp.]